MNVFSGSLNLKPKAFGMTWHRSPVTVDDPPQPTTAAWIRSHGYGVDPYRARWDYMEPAPPVNGVHAIDFSGTDVLVDYHARHGRRVLFNLFGTPRWAAARPDDPSPFGPGVGSEPADPQTFADYVHAVVSRYRGNCDYEIWNEPNRKWDFFTGRIDKMAELVRYGARPIRDVDPGAKIISPPITNLSAELGGCDYLKALLQMDTGDGSLVRDWVDAVGVHLYAKDFDRIGTIATELIPGVRLAMAAAGCAAWPLWDTEHGQLSPNLMQLSRAQRAHAIWAITVLTLCHSMGGADCVCWYAADNGTVGFLPEDIGVYNDTLALLTSGTLTQVDLDEATDDVAAVIGGRHYVR
jgi:hypothetical protein